MYYSTFCGGPCNSLNPAQTVEFDEDSSLDSATIGQRKIHDTKRKIAHNHRVYFRRPIDFYTGRFDFVFSRQIPVFAVRREKAAKAAALFDGFRETGRRDLCRGRVADVRGRNVCAVGTCVFLTYRKGCVTRKAEKENGARERRRGKS